MREEGQYDALVHNAERCDKSFGQGGSVKRRSGERAHGEGVSPADDRRKSQGSGALDHRAAGPERGGLLKAKDVTTVSVTNVQGQSAEISARSTAPEAPAASQLNLVTRSISFVPGLSHLP